MASQGPVQADRPAAQLLLLSSPASAGTGCEGRGPLGTKR